MFHFIMTQFQNAFHTPAADVVLIPSATEEPASDATESEIMSHVFPPFDPPRVGPWRIAPAPLQPLTYFPCHELRECHGENRVCERHRNVSFIIDYNTKETFTIPFLPHSCGYWIKQRIRDVTAIPIDEQRIVFAGCEWDNFRIKTGVQMQSTIHLIRKKTANSAAAPTESDIAAASKQALTQ